MLMWCPNAPGREGWAWGGSEDRLLTSTPRKGDISPPGVFPFARGSRVGLQRVVIIIISISIIINIIITIIIIIIVIIIIIIIIIIIVPMLIIIINNIRYEHTKISPRHGLNPHCSDAVARAHTHMHAHVHIHIDMHTPTPTLP